ncbi:Guanylate-binding protein 6 [Thoreauomyces humboldtii]|nr:Guanylate-binding protein 6 [Thoreauomyces humboldtii]
MGSCCSKVSSNSKNPNTVTPDLVRETKPLESQTQADPQSPNAEKPTRADPKPSRWPSDTDIAERFGIPPALANLPNRLSPLHAKPVHLIKPLTDKTSRAAAQFSVTEEGRDLLTGISKPLSVIAISGTFRHGKSFLMNQLYGVQSGFELGSTSRGCTRGVWAWAFEQSDRDDVLLLLDFEGLGDPDNRNPGYDMQLFSLAILLSSTLIFNRIGSAIDLEQIRSLSLVWVDSFLKHVEISPGTHETDDEYLERVLAESGDYDLTNDFFPNRHLRRMPVPVLGPDKLRHMELVRPNEIRSIWYEEMASLRELLAEVTKPKNICSTADSKSTHVNGNDFALIIDSYISSFNNKAIPTISNAWDTLCENSRN